MGRNALIISVSVLMATTPAWAEVEPLNLPEKEERAPYRLTIGATTQIISEDNKYLGTRSDEGDSGIIGQTQAGLHISPSDAVRAYIEGRMLYNTGIARISEEGESEERSATFAELRQAWVAFDVLADLHHTTLTIGRQRLREERGLWWNRDVDALRFNYDNAPTSGFIAVSQNMNDYRIGEDDYFRAQDRERFRVIGETRHAFSPSHYLEIRGLYEHDHSGTPGVGSIAREEDRDDEDGHLLWAGLRLGGKLMDSGAPLTYRIDGMGVAGSEKISDSISGPAGGQRTITGTRKRDVMGWAIDGEIDIAAPTLPLHPVFTLGYAFGSGESNPAGTDTDQGFRQSDLHSPSSRPGYEFRHPPLRHYGEVLRPELSNIHIIKAGMQVPFLDHSHLTLRYFSYWLDEVAGGLRSAGIKAPLNGTDSHLGQALDFAVDVPVGRELGWRHAAARSLSSRFIVGGFKAGEAYGPADDENAWRAAAEMRIRF